MSASSITESYHPNLQSDPVNLFLCGDVVLGRGIDQILAHSCPPILYESYVKDARHYILLAIKKNGQLPTNPPVQPHYLWGCLLEEFQKHKPDVKIINLETSITSSDTPWPHKPVCYRMHPDNVDVIKAAGIDIALLANNHVMDWGTQSLIDTLTTLKNAGIKSAGAGLNQKEAESPVIMDIPHKKARVLVFSFGSPDSGVPTAWAADGNRPGVAYVDPVHPASFIEKIKELISRYKGPRDIVVFSIHWGSNWGFEIEAYHRNFARELIDTAGVDLIHGHSSHHIKGIEVYKGKLIVYGAGDFIDDYEGIEGYEEYRDDLGLMYFPSVDQVTGHVTELLLIPTRICHLKVNRATSSEDLDWIEKTLNREGAELGTSVHRTESGTFRLKW
ncbi:uncharacterized protein VTP21DRAFT_5303 [Calcarisporiella thermophila]|uniref:uncharacterized protein n=1 Tax=Calcarisporiella thermophila TaxID=911321 RepID=UPI0037446AFD